MWKYRSQQYFLLLNAGLVLGIVLAYLFYHQLMAIVDYFPKEYAEQIRQQPTLIYTMSAFLCAALPNLFMLANELNQRFRIGAFGILLLLYLKPVEVLFVAMILVIPAWFISLYGWLSLNRQRKGLVHYAGNSESDELFRILKLHVQLDEGVKDLAQACARTYQRYTLWQYSFIFLMIVVTFVAYNPYILVGFLLLYFFVTPILARYRAVSQIPITSLLYESCEPDRCLSAIYYYCQTFRQHRLRLHALLAECLIYMEQPELAQDVLILYPRKDRASNLIYWTLNAWVYYLLKDEANLNRCYEEASKVALNIGGTGVMIQSAELASIQAKINLMDGQLSNVKRYYLNALKKAQFLYQRVVASYYIALISFVEQDYVVAENYFSFVAENAGSMSIKQKAQDYLSQLPVGD